MQNEKLKVIPNYASTSGAHGLGLSEVCKFWRAGYQGMLVIVLTWFQVRTFQAG